MLSCERACRRGLVNVFLHYPSDHTFTSQICVSLRLLCRESWRIWRTHVTVKAHVVWYPWRRRGIGFPSSFPRGAPLVMQMPRGSASETTETAARPRFLSSGVSLVFRKNNTAFHPQTAGQPQAKPPGAEAGYLRGWAIPYFRRVASPLLSGLEPNSSSEIHRVYR